MPAQVAYFAHLEECLNKYPRAFLVDADFVGSKQISDIRIALRGKAELVFGKNTMIRRCIRNLTADDSHPEWAALLPYMVGNIGFVFTQGSFEDLEAVIKEYVKPAAAKAGVIAPVSCTIPKGPTGLDPAQTSFFQALNIATKINKGSIEIINDCTVIQEGNKVGTSEAALLTKLGVKPFSYGLNIKYVYEGGVFPVDVLKITDDLLMTKFMDGVGNVAAISLATGIPTEAALPHYIIKGAKNVVAVALELEVRVPRIMPAAWPHVLAPCAEPLCLPVRSSSSLISSRRSPAFSRPARRRAPRGGPTYQSFEYESCPAPLVATSAEQRCAGYFRFFPFSSRLAEIVGGGGGGESAHDGVCSPYRWRVAR